MLIDTTTHSTPTVTLTAVYHRPTVTLGGKLPNVTVGPYATLRYLGRSAVNVFFPYFTGLNYKFGVDMLEFH